MIRYLSKEQVITIHRWMIERYGGSDGIRDNGILDSALDAPKAGFGGDFLYKTVPEIAAVYLFHICQNHPFVDGNKRVAAGAATIFARSNGWHIGLTDEELAELTLKVAASELSKAALTTVFEKLLQPPTTTN